VLIQKKINKKSANQPKRRKKKKKAKNENPKEKQGPIVKSQELLLVSSMGLS